MLLFRTGAPLLALVAFCLCSNLSTGHPQHGEFTFCLSSLFLSNFHVQYLCNCKKLPVVSRNDQGFPPARSISESFVSHSLFRLCSSARSSALDALFRFVEQYNYVYVPVDVHFVVD